mmetsp:Transcript_32839/g.68844  ORF Transcript_32839/g.68844 Transcript_32839/m.68844 type:complete len:207 (-) Transcript_32839:215-835(-)
MSLAAFSPQAREHLSEVLSLKQHDSMFRARVGGNRDPFYDTARGASEVCSGYKCPAIDSDGHVDVEAAAVCAACGGFFGDHEPLAEPEKGGELPAKREMPAPSVGLIAPCAAPRAVVLEDTSDPMTLNHSNDPLAVFASQPQPHVRRQTPQPAEKSLLKEKTSLWEETNSAAELEKVKKEIEQIMLNAQSKEDIERMLQSMRASQK